MSHKQKLGYILLGAGIMALGITIGQFITPNIEAQSNGVFDKIVCREIEVVDENGRQAILISSANGTAFVTIVDIHSGMPGVMLGSTDESNYVSVSDNQEKESVLLSGGKDINGLSVFDKKLGIPAINLLSDEKQSVVAILDKKGAMVIVLASNDKKNAVVVIDKTGKEMRLGD